MNTLAELTKQAISLSTSPKKRFLELGSRLRALQERSPESFKKAFVHCGLRRRHAYYLVKISRQVERANLSQARLRKLGWTKLELIANYLSGAEALKYIKLAEKYPAHDLKLLVQGKKPQPKTRCVQMYFSPEQYRRFEQVVLRHGARRSGRGLIDKEPALIRAIQ